MGTRLVLLVRFRLISCFSPTEIRRVQSVRSKLCADRLAASGSTPYHTHRFTSYAYV